MADKDTCAPEEKYFSVKEFECASQYRSTRLARKLSSRDKFSHAPSLKEQIGSEHFELLLRYLERSSNKDTGTTDNTETGCQKNKLSSVMQNFKKALHKLDNEFNVLCQCANSLEEIMGGLHTVQGVDAIFYDINTDTFRDTIASEIEAAILPLISAGEEIKYSAVMIHRALFLKNGTNKKV